jgi:methylthioribose-1-phosphate isomerase
MPQIYGNPPINGYKKVMNVAGKHHCTIWFDETNTETVNIIDQLLLPHQFKITQLNTVADIIYAIKEMQVRGAGLIGATAGYGMYFAAKEAAAAGDYNLALNDAAKRIMQTRPTAVNLAWAVNRQQEAIAKGNTIEEKVHIAQQTAIAIASEDAENGKNIGLHGVQIIEAMSKQKNGAQVNILTHCNAGWLAFVDYGSATAPIYEAFERGIPVHVWVDETRPRNQGASLTAWELLNHGVPHTVIADNTGGHLMQHGMVDMVITGTDRVTRTGDAANKIGTYLKALAAKDNHIPFYVALPSSTFDWQIRDGIKEIEIEERSATEVTHITGLCDGEIRTVQLTPTGSTAKNFGFDVTPARLITSLITERGICGAGEEEILRLFPEFSSSLV